MANTTKNRVTKCVMARISRNGQPYQKNFGLREFRTWKAAEEAAQKWLAKIKKTLPPPRERVGRMTKRNQSGVVGVYPRITTFENATTRIDYCRWYARWPGCPLKGGISFSTEIFGDDEAFVRAYLARENQTVDREWIERRFNTFRKTKKYDAVIDRKKLVFVADRSK